MAIEYINQLFHRSDASGSKSTILKPLTWLISLLIGGLITSAYLKTDKWLKFYIVILVTIVFLLFIFTYIYCLLKIPDALRSEKFSIQKMAIEKGIYGDSASGTFNIDITNTPKAINSQVIDSDQDKEIIE